MISRLQKAAAGRIGTMACCGIRENAGRIVEKTGVHELPAALWISAASPIRFRNEKIAIGSIQSSEYKRLVVLPETVAGPLRAAASAAAAPKLGK